MAVIIQDELRTLLQSPETVKALATVDKEGNPYVTYKDSIHINDKGELEFYEMIETSQTNKNLVYSIWFDRLVTINILGKNKQSFLIKGKLKKVEIYGKEYEKHYQKVQDKFGNIDLAGVWKIEPIAIQEDSFQKRREEEEKEHPLLRHLDRLLVEDWENIKE